MGLQETQMTFTEFLLERYPLWVGQDLNYINRPVQIIIEEAEKYIIYRDAQTKKQFKLQTELKDAQIKKEENK